MIVITGGAGFIGSCLLKYLNDKGIMDILVVDNLGKTEKWKNLVGKDYINYAHKDHFLELLRDEEFNVNIDCIFHLGACTDTTETDIDYLYDNNVRYSLEIARICQESGIKLVYASSAATYGKGEDGFSDEVYFDLKPLNGYGFSKYELDKFLIITDHLQDTIGFKFFNVFGPNEYHKGSMASMVYKAYNQINETGKIKLFKSNSPDFEDGEQKRDFIYVKDVCEVLYAAYKNEEIVGIYNLGTGVARSWNDLAKAVFKAMGKEVNIEYIDMPDKLKGQYQNFTEADLKNFREYGFKQEFTSLEDAVDDYVSNYLESNKYL